MSNGGFVQEFRQASLLDPDTPPYWQVNRHCTRTLPRSTNRLPCTRSGGESLTGLALHWCCRREHGRQEEGFRWLSRWLNRYPI